MILGFPVWILLMVSSVVFWVGLLCWPVRGATSIMDFTPMVDAAARLVGGIILTMAVWLVYFIFV